MLDTRAQEFDILLENEEPRFSEENSKTQLQSIFYIIALSATTLKPNTAETVQKIKIKCVQNSPS
jgi:hypothetical protein